jgi:hypothetical protein
MYALKVRVNSEAAILVGKNDLGVLSAFVTCVGVLGDASHALREGQQADLFLSAGGRTSRPPELPDEHLRWISNRPLQVGDVVSMELLETDVADAPTSGVEAEKQKHDEREYFEHCKKAYYSMREKYEV